ILHLDDPMFSGSILLQHDLCVLSSLEKERLGEFFSKHAKLQFSNWTWFTPIRKTGVALSPNLAPQGIKVSRADGPVAQALKLS
ncbi:hypothetical protein, partial [Halomicronema sp. CCY15110]|uniref:hypothetical protein n=1 Tax=Halomicronema sp. CCY15110 TaxID=2767773 RepID=UPI00194F5B0C